MKSPAFDYIRADSPQHAFELLAKHGDDARVILFIFAPGQELSEHTASRPALIHILEGAGTVGLDSETFDASPGLLVHMAAGLPHSIVATTELRMLLYLFGK